MVKKACILNILLFLLVLFSIIWMMSGITKSALSISGFSSLRYFTVDSDILLGILSLAAAVDEWRVWKGGKTEVSTRTLVLKLVATVGVSLTMLVTVFFLAPTTFRQYGWFGMFKGSNFFLHLVNPILAIAVFLRYEGSGRLPFAHTFTAFVPMLLYAVYYLAETLSHVENGVIAKGYDWYGFFFNGVSSAWIMVPLLIAVTYAISFALWRLSVRFRSEP
ncbi:MAG: hypothetical protein K6C12_01600 [Oscillospiraceae bacterium]|nr:hypothetical protein [Oscillospiraceae bacterium]